jgi:phosphotransferase system HPr (HPr) family protein
MMLAAAQGSKITVTAKGADAEAAVKELEQLFANKFNED